MGGGGLWLGDRGDVELWSDLGFVIGGVEGVES